jgi:Recombinase zinc beta ribbon domain/Resolvase, N terminal domain/Recombinase
MKPILRYTRVSRRGKRDVLLSHPDQVRTIDRMGERFDLPFWPEVLSDTDRSGGTFEREAFQRGLELIRSGQAGGYAFAHLDRFGRMHPLESIDMVRDIQSAGGVLYADDLGGRVKLETMQDLIMYVIKSAGGYEERERKMEGLRATRERNIRNGRHLGKTFGYLRPTQRTTIGDDDKALPPLVPDPETKGAVIHAYERRGEGAAWQTIANELDKHWPLTKGHWTWTRVRSMVKTRTYLGIAFSGDPNDPEAVDNYEHIGAHEALVTQAQWDAANEPMAGPKPPARREQRYLLSYFLRCGSCGYRMRAGVSGGRKGKDAKHAYYRCKAKHKAGPCPNPVHLSVAAADEVIWPLVLERAALLNRGVEQIEATERVSEAQQAADIATLQYERAELRSIEASTPAAQRVAEKLAAEKEQTMNNALDALDIARREAKGLNALGVDIDADGDPDTWELADRRDLVGAVFPVVFARGDRTMDIADRLRPLRPREAPDNLPGDRRMRPVREYFV